MRLHQRRRRLRPHLPHLRQRLLVGHLHLVAVRHDRPRDHPIETADRSAACQEGRRGLAAAHHSADHFIRRRRHARVRVEHRPPLRHRLVLESLHRPGAVPQRRRYARVVLVRHRIERRRHPHPGHGRRFRHEQSRPLRHALTDLVLPLLLVARRGRRIARHTARPLSQGDQLIGQRVEKTRRPCPDEILEAMPGLVEIDLALRLPRVSHVMRRLVMRRMHRGRLALRAPHLHAHRLVHVVHDRTESPALSWLVALDAFHQPPAVAGLRSSEHPIRRRRRTSTHRLPRRHLRRSSRLHLPGRDGWPSRRLRRRRR